MTNAAPDEPLVLGPCSATSTRPLRRCGCAPRHRARVTVERAGRTWSAPTVAVHGSHYALVVLDGLLPAATTPTRCASTTCPSGRDAGMPPSRIRTLDPNREPHFAFGTCRTTGSARRRGQQGARRRRAAHPGAGAARRRRECAGRTCCCCSATRSTPTPPRTRSSRSSWRRGAASTSRRAWRSRTSSSTPSSTGWPGASPVIRWVLSTVPSAMIFDDHDIRDDWNTSWSWQREIRATTWWQERIVSGLGSYWVHQHLGNLSPAELAQEEVWRRCVEHEAVRRHRRARPDRARRRARGPRRRRARRRTGGATRRALGDCALVVIDSRAARELRPDGALDARRRRAALGRRQCCSGGVRHLFVGTSLPFLLPPGLHDFEAMDEALAQGAYGRTVARAAEKLRRSIDLEHWAAFNEGFDELFDLVMQVARGERGPAPQTITFLSGDVHNSYLAEVDRPAAAGRAVAHRAGGLLADPQPDAAGRAGRSCRCSRSRWCARCGSSRPHSPDVPSPAYPWTVTDGPWFDNNISLVTVGPNEPRAHLGHRRRRGRPEARPRLQQVYAVRLDPLPAATAQGAVGVRSGLTTTAEHRGRRLALVRAGDVRATPPRDRLARPAAPRPAPKDAHDAHQRARQRDR